MASPLSFTQNTRITLAEGKAQGAMQQLQQSLKLVSELQKLTRQIEAEVQNALTAQLAAMQQVQTQKLVSEVQILTAQLAETNAQGAIQQLQTRQLESKLQKLKTRLAGLPELIVMYIYRPQPSHGRRIQAVWRY
jgi:hypothetical protein